MTGVRLAEKSYEYQVAARDFIARSFAEFAKQEATVSIALTGQTVLDNTCGVVCAGRCGIEIRFRINLPALMVVAFLRRKRTTSSPFYLPKFIRRATLSRRELNIDAMIKHCETIEDQGATCTAR
ncbi:hypothetical protein OK016_22695 [Vibrio chagasii]|nr:hypothetical protein [Vibrio chagasii]